VVIHTWYVVREDSAQLFGFLQSEDRALFKILLSISGIGPKSALAVLSGLTQSELEEAVAQQDVDRLQRLPGIGRKTAERLLLELKDKIKISVLLPRQAGAGGGREDYGEAMEALSSLGYTQFQARTALQKVLDQDLPAREPGKDRVAELVKRALKHL
jgi:Holliday junction DNA helicase RuvA